MRVLAIAVVLVAGCAADDVSDNGDGGGSGAGGGTGSGTDASTSNGEPPGLEGTVAAHNAERALVGVGPLTWDPALAAIATAWVQQCHDTDQPIGLVDHNAGRSNGYPTYVGENIYGAGGQATGVDAVGLWASEKANYNHANNSCSGTCGHYTQIVWRNTTKVGCALHHCAGLQFGWTVVCDYAPGGNIGNQSPY